MATVAREASIELFVNLSQMTVSEMGLSATTTTSPQQKLHWLG